jgi:hypothetical protein
MKLIQIDIFRTEAPQAPFGGGDQRLTPEASGWDFCREEYLLTRVADSLADDFFRSIDFGCVNEESSLLNSGTKWLDTPQVPPGSKANFWNSGM